MDTPVRFLSRYFLHAACACTVLLPAAGCNRNADSQNKAASGIPVVAVKADRKDMPIRLEAVGNVESIASVALKSRVDGQIVRVAIDDGADVVRGQVLFEIDPRPAAARLKQAQARLAGDLAQAGRTRDQEKRYQDLLQKRFISPDAYNQIRANLDSAEAAVEADRAAVDNARLEVEYATLRAPITGRAGRIQIQIGNMVKANDSQPLVAINQLAPIFVNFAVPERFLPQIRKAMRGRGCAVDITTRGGADGGGTSQGKLTFVDNAVDPATGTIRLRATVPNRDARLWPGQFVTASVLLGTERNAVTVPTDAVMNGPNGTYVFVVDGAGKAGMQSVAVSRNAGAEAVIASGLKGGELVVTDGQSRLLPGVAVEIRSPPPR